MVKKLPTKAGDVDLIPGLGRFPGGGNSKPLQYSCLGNPMDRGAWWATVQGVTKNQTQLSTHTHVTFSTMTPDSVSTTLWLNTHDSDVSGS